MNRHHAEILAAIKGNSGVPTQHTFSDSYLGNSQPRFAINAPTMRKVAKEWMKDHREMKAAEFQKVMTSLIHGKSGTEKVMVGIFLDLATKEQQQFDPGCFDQWLDQLEGWAQVDSVCTGSYTVAAIASNFPVWKKLLIRFSKSKNINKRRASIVFLCSPLRNLPDKRLADLAILNVERLKHEKEILITKAISWVLRSMAKHHKDQVRKYVENNRGALPAIAVRETLTKIRTGTKAGK